MPLASRSSPVASFTKSSTRCLLYRGRCGSSVKASARPLCRQAACPQTRCKRGWSKPVLYFSATRILFIDAEKLLPLVQPGGLVLAHNIDMVPDYVRAVTANPDLDNPLLYAGQSTRRDAQETLNIFRRHPRPPGKGIYCVNGEKQRASV
jgi:hypothetical protein